MDETTDVRCTSCGRLIGRTRSTRSVVVYCLSPMCPYVAPMGENDTRDSAIATMSAIGWAKTHLADAFSLSRQRVIQVVQAARKAH